MKVLNMTKKEETPHFAFRYFIEDNSVIVALCHNADGTSVNTGEHVPQEERDGFVPIFGLRFFQEGSLVSLITKCNEALDDLKMLNETEEPPCTQD